MPAQQASGSAREHGHGHTVNAMWISGIGVLVAVIATGIVTAGAVDESISLFVRIFGMLGQCLTGVAAVAVCLLALYFSNPDR